MRFTVKRIFTVETGRQALPVCATPQSERRFPTIPQSQKPAQAGFCGVAPLASNIPGAGDCQGPPSEHTGRLALALTGTGHRYTSPLGGATPFSTLRSCCCCGFSAAALCSVQYCLLSACTFPESCPEHCAVQHRHNRHTARRPLRRPAAAFQCRSADREYKICCPRPTGFLHG